MIDRKQLSCFVVSADVGSFSEAAAILYTTQSNISKIIAGLEADLGFDLFQREGRGVRLTERGRRFYQGASRLLAQFETLENESVTDRRSIVRIGALSGSWFAEKFTAFYKIHEAEHLYFNVHTDSTRQLVRRVHDMEDEVGFINIFPDEQNWLQYQLKRYQLQFEILREMDGMLYFSPENENAPAQTNGALQNCRLIQKEKDPFIQYGGWRTEDGTALETASPDIAVMTNSDYIMQQMLRQSNVANISTESFRDYPEGHAPGQRLTRSRGRISFGVVTNDRNPPSAAAEAFIDFIRENCLARQ